MAKQKQDTVAPKGKQKGKGGGSRKPAGLVNRKQVQYGEVTRNKRGQKVNRVTTGKPNKTGSSVVDFQVKRRGKVQGAFKGASYRNPAGKKVAMKNALDSKGRLRSGHTLSYRNKMRTGTRNQEIVGGGNSG